MNDMEMVESLKGFVFDRTRFWLLFVCSFFLLYYNFRSNDMYILKYLMLKEHAVDM